MCPLSAVRQYTVMTNPEKQGGHFSAIRHYGVLTDSLGDTHDRGFDVVVGWY